METEKINYVKEIKHLIVDIFATSLWVIAIKMIILPNEIAPGGATGITVIINYLTGWNIGLLSFLVNLPLLAYAWKTLGRVFVFRTLVTVTTFTIMMDYVVPDIPVYTNDPLLATIMGGVLNGIGTGLVFLCGSSGGGSDLMVKLVKHKKPHLSVGQLALAINGGIMMAASIVYGNFEAMLYGLVLTFTSGQVIDLILNGMASANSITIITNVPQVISEKVISELGRSATIVDGRGAFSSKEVGVMFCVVRRPELQKLKDLVQFYDPNAFIIIQEAKQVLGRNFMEKNII